MRDAANLFDFSTPQANQYNALAPDCALLADAVLRYATRPRMLHATCLRVLRRLDIRMANGDCPDRSQDADLDDFYRSLTAIAADLAEHDRHTRAAATATSAAPSATLSPEAAATLIEAADHLATQSEGPLAEELPQDARRAADPAATPEDRREALYITASRLLRAWVAAGYGGAKATLHEIDGLTKTVASIGKNVALIAASSGAIAWLASAIAQILRLFP